MIWYTVASLTPAALLALACVFGSLWPLMSVLSITVFVFFMDKLSRLLPVTQATGHGLSMVLAGVHFVLLALGVWALAGDHLEVLDKVLIYIGLGLFFGQISNSNAHELIHAGARFPRRIGTAIYVSLLHGHHVSAHLRVHHVQVATPDDPNSARRGEGFWAYALRVLRGEFIAGFQAEQTHRARTATPLSELSHPYLGYVGGAVLALLISHLIAGGAGVLAHIAIAFYAQLQLLLSDYVQHYGLRRRIGQNGKPEPVGPQHSWNAPKWYSAAMMLNAPRHSDHHLRPARAFPALEITEDMPVLPHSLPVMAVVALFPPFWRRVMDRRVARWQERA